MERHGFLTRISILASSLSLVNGYLVLLKGTDTYETVIRSVMSFIGREYLNISEINVAFLTNMLNIYLKRRSDERNRKLIALGKRIPYGLDYGSILLQSKC